MSRDAIIKQQCYRQSLSHAHEFIGRNPDVNTAAAKLSMRAEIQDAHGSNAIAVLYIQKEAMDLRVPS